MKDRHQIRYEQLMQEELSKLLLREFDIEPGILVTISEVEVSSDFHFADIKMSIFPQDQESEIIERLNRQHKEFEYFLADILERRKSPELRFRLDAGVQHQYEMEKVLDEVK